MSSGYLTAVMRRSAATVACLLLAACAALWTAPRSGATPTRSTDTSPPPASRDAVLQALGVRDVPAEIVLLVDISGSMESNNLYATVRRDVRAFLQILKKDDPDDLVGVITFGGPHDGTVADPGPPNPDIWLPPQANAQETDCGPAFELAYNMFLEGAEQNIKVGGVLLLSDGEVSMPYHDDPTYGTGFTARAWKTLRAEVQALRMAITGYDVPLTGNPAFTGNQNTALSKVFYPVQQLPYSTTDLNQALGVAKLRILDRKVASVAAQDSGKGVRVSWGGLQGDHGKPLDLSTGHAYVSLTLAAATQRVPLYLSGLSITSTGLPVTMRGTIPGGLTLLPRHHPSTVRIRLTWTPKRNGQTMTGSPRSMRAALKLDATVSSGFTPTLASDFDTAFSAGGLHGAISPLFTASEPVQWDIREVLLIVLGVMVVLGGCVCFMARMTGTLVLSTVGPVSGSPASGGVRLRGLPWRSCRTQQLIGEPGRITVHGSMLGPEIRCRLRIPKRDPFDGLLLPGEPQIQGGITVLHKPPDKRARFPWRRTRAR